MDKLAKSLPEEMLTVFLPVSLDPTLPWVRCRLRRRGGRRFLLRLELVGPPTLVLSMPGPTPGRGRRGVASVPEARRRWVTVASARRWKVTDSLRSRGLEMEVGSWPDQMKS